LPSTVELDKSTPKWPEALINLSAPAKITVGGLTTPLTSLDVRAEAVELLAKQAAAHGHPIRAKATTDDGWVQRMIVTEHGQVVLIGKRPPTTPPPKTSQRKAGPAAPITRAAERFDAVPAWFRWVVIGAVVALVLALLVLVLHRTPDPAQDAPPPVPPIPAPGQVYTETPPPGWSTHAAWVVPLATHSPSPVTDPATGFTAAITPTDQSAPGLGPFDDNDLYLSVLAPDGHTAWAAPLDRLPVLGPVLATIDGAATVVIVDARTATYWPLTGGTPTVVDLPAGARATENPGTSVLFALGRGRAGYLSAGKVKIVDVLPRTKPLAAVDGAVLQWQQDKHAWWNVSAAAPPRRVTVTPGIAAAVLPPVHAKPVPGQLVPTGHTSDLLMVVTAGRLYALTREQ
jgi:hypothetical protein